MSAPKGNLSLKQVAREAGLLPQRGEINKTLCPVTFLGPDNFTWGAVVAHREWRCAHHTHLHHYQRPQTLADIPRTYGPAFIQACVPSLHADTDLVHTHTCLLLTGRC